MKNGGHVHHCRELVTGRNLTGTLNLSKNQITTKIYSFDEFFYIPDDDPIYLQIDSTEFVALHRNLTSGCGHTTTFKPTQRSVFSAEIFSTYAIIGHDQWTPDDRVKRVSFEMDGADLLFGPSKNLATHLRSRVRLAPKRIPIFSLSTPRYHVESYYEVSPSLGTEYKDSTRTIFEIEFYEDVEFGSHFEPINWIAFFFSLSLAAPLRPKNIYICRKSKAEQLAAVAAGNERCQHYVHTSRADVPFSPTPESVLGSPFIGGFEDELLSLSTCLKLWLERAKEWNGAYSMLIHTVCRQREISTDRFLDAYRWLEETPTSNELTTAKDDDYEEILNAAKSAAQGVGRADLCSRIDGALRGVKFETHRERMSRLVKQLERKFDFAECSSKLISDLIRARKLRGRIAHGYDDFSSESQARELRRLTSALEFLCVMLTLDGVPVSESGMQRLSNHSMVSNYLDGA